jgi:hypothetical protein
MAPLVVPPAKTDRLEKDEQKQFVSWCMLHNLPYVWHGTHKRSSANLGVPDFIVGVNRQTFYLEFKRDFSCALTKEQQQFAECCLEQGLFYRVVYSCGEAIKLIEAADSL